ncbi:MAG: hypothetical protein WA175_06665 [Candidatus Acidiferrales bacterium]
MKEKIKGIRQLLEDGVESLAVEGYPRTAKIEGYRKTLEDAKDDLLTARRDREAAIRRQEELENRIMELRRTVAALSALCGEEFNEDDEFGLTDSIRMALKTHGGALNAQQVKTRLEQLGFKTSSTNLLASVHTILKRLVLKGELDDTAVDLERKTMYRWIQKPRSVAESTPCRTVREDILADPTD